MNYAVALLFTLIGSYDEMNTVSVADAALGTVHFTSYKGYTGKCAIHFNKSGGESDSYVTVAASVDEAVNPHYIGLRGDKLARSNYTTYVMPARHQQGFGDYVLLNTSSDFGVAFESRDVKTRITKVVSCDVKTCTCAPKL
jgi:hypothetical protein